MTDKRDILHAVVNEICDKLNSFKTENDLKDFLLNDLTKTDDEVRREDKDAIRRAGQVL
jgi:hypothetical protein